MEINEHVVAYQSVINSDFTVFVVYKEHEGYNGIKESLKKMNDSIGALWVGTKNIFMDGEVISDDAIDRDHLLAIEALAIALLEMDSHTRAASLLKERLKELYNIDYAEFEESWEDDLEDESFQD